MKFVTYADWDQLPRNAKTLFSKGEKDSIFFSRQWFNNFLRTSLDDGHTLLLACVVDGDSVLSILPIMKPDNSEYWHSLSNYNSSLYRILLADKKQQEILNCLVQGLSLLPLVELTLDPIAENDENMLKFQRVMESSDFYCLQPLRFVNWFHQLQGQSFEAYMASRPSRVRNTIERKKRKLEREHGYDIRLFIDNDLQQAMLDYNAIYQASWKTNERFAGFVEGLVQSLAKPGWLRFAILYIEEKPVAAQIWFVAHGKANIFRLVYDQNWKKYSPGSILTHYLMKHVINIDRVEEIDFLTGNDAYKKEWMSESRTRWGLIFAKKQKPKSKATWLTWMIKVMKLLKKY